MPETSSRPKSRFDLVSAGIGRLTGGVVNLVLGGLVLFFADRESVMWRNIGMTLSMLGAILLGMGVWRIVTGARAPQKEIACPHCGESNTLLAGVTEFACYNCSKPLKLVRK